MLKNLVTMVIVASGLVGCAMSAHIPLSQENSKKIQTADVRSMVIQDEVIAMADPSNVSGAMGGGLIPALIDSSLTGERQDKLQAAMNAFYESVEEYDFRAVYWPQLTKELREQYPLKVKTIVTTLRGVGYRDEQKISAALEENQAQILMATSYFLSSDLRTLNVSTKINLWMKGGMQPAYRNTLIYQSPVLGTGGEQSAKAWSLDGGKPFFERLNEGIRETLAMLSIDIKDNAPASATAEKLTIDYNYGGARPPERSNIKGTVVEKHGARVILRSETGLLYSLSLNGE